MACYKANFTRLFLPFCVKSKPGLLNTLPAMLCYVTRSRADADRVLLPFLVTSSHNKFKVARKIKHKELIMFLRFSKLKNIQMKDKKALLYKVVQI
jgi:hypothetical protein